MGRCAGVSGIFALVAALSAGAAGADTLPVVADGHVSAADDETNGPSLRVRHGADAPGYTALARFDLSALPDLPPGSSIEKATLRLWAEAVRGPGSIAVAPVLEAWDERTLSYAAAPAMGQPRVTFAVDADDAQRYVTVDVTDLVRDWTSGAKNRGLALAAAPDEAVDVDFDSKENTATSHAPDVEVVITSVGPQ